MKRFFRTAESLWMKFALAVGWLNTRILLTLTYVLLVGPIALLLKIFRKRLVDRKWKTQESYWIEKEKVPNTLERHRRQF